jgi:U2-associated protein SR140
MLIQQIMSLEHMYYRWRVYSYMQGDGDKKYRIERFQIVENGFTWFPPISQSHNPYPLVMNLKQTKYFTECLQKMERRKYAIEEAMIFALHDINYAVHISLIILMQLHDSLKSDFIGIMYLISDILFNSQNHIYRNIFQSRLPYFIDTYLTLRQTNEAATINDKFFI